MRLALKFAAALAETISVVAYAEFENVIEVDRDVVQCGLCTTQPIISQNDPFISVQFVLLLLLVLGLSCRSLLLVASGSQFSVVCQRVESA